MAASSAVQQNIEAFLSPIFSPCISSQNGIASLTSKMFVTSHSLGNVYVHIIYVK